MGYFNGKVGEEGKYDIVGQFGFGMRNENRQCIVDCCTKHNLMVAKYNGFR